MLALRSFCIALLLLLGLLVDARAAVEIPMQYSSGLVWLKVSVPGKTERLDFLLDSGAGASVVNLRTARELGLQLGSSERVQGVTGSTTGHWIGNFAGSVATIELPKRVIALDLTAVSAACHRKVDGLVGVEFFRNRSVQIDFAAQRVRVLDRDEVPAGSGIAIPLARRGDTFCTRVSVDQSAQAWVRVDTGCDSALRWVASAGVAKSRSANPTVAVALRDSGYLTTDVQLGAMRVPSVETGLHAQAIFLGESGLLGNGLLSRFRVTFDAPCKRLILEPR